MLLVTKKKNYSFKYGSSDEVVKQEIVMMLVLYYITMWENSYLDSPTSILNY